MNITPLTFAKTVKMEATCPVTIIIDGRIMNKFYTTLSCKKSYKNASRNLVHSEMQRTFQFVFLATFYKQ